jgi:hypothetical protein
MTQAKSHTSLAAHEPRDLLRQTLRTVAVLVGACVLFVGVLSVAAVAITNKAMAGPGEGKAAEATDSASAVPNKPGLSRPRADVGPQSI